jgi:hypothetical protein
VKVILKGTIEQQIKEAIRSSERTGKEITRIELTRQEAEELADIFCLSGAQRALHLAAGWGNYAGVSLEWPKS